MKDDSKEFDFKTIGRSDIRKNGGIIISKNLLFNKSNENTGIIVRINFS